MEWILASASPRRKQLFKELVAQFDILPAKGEEILPADCSPRQAVEFLAEQKAREIALMDVAQRKCVLGADTVVACDGEILGKPKDEADARRMLKKLSGREHEVYTGVSIGYFDGAGKRLFLTKSDATKVFFFALTDEKIETYIQSGSPMDKAGAYGIQDGGLVERIEGSFSNVVGLPIERIQQMMEIIE